nr:MAG TPA: hypothetical protein [Caudoviricetes sp.]
MASSVSWSVALVASALSIKNCNLTYQVLDRMND